MSKMCLSRWGKNTSLNSAISLTLRAFVTLGKLSKMFLFSAVLKSKSLRSLVGSPAGTYSDAS